MKRETIDKYIAAWLPVIQSGKRTAAALEMLIKEVERDTRHAACDEVNKLHSRIHNLDH